MDPDVLAALKALVDPTRLRILGRLAAHAASAGDLARELKLPRGSIDRHVGRLKAAGLLRADGDVLELELDRLNALGRALHGLESGAEGIAAVLAEPTGPDGEPLPPDEAKVLRGFFEGDRLREIPAQDRKRRVVLRYLRDRCFTEDRGYPEKEVNQRLALFHPDVASLRRYMVDSGLMTRAGGEYRRAAPSRLDGRETA